MAIVDYKYKSYVLNEHSDLISKIKKANMQDYACKVFAQQGVITYTMKNNENLNGCSALQVWQEAVTNGLVDEYHEAMKIIKAEYVRRTRLRKRIDTILSSGPSLFLTLTFRDEALNDTTEKERRVAVSRYLKSLGAQYVANIDYGGKNGREHYHAVVNIGSIDSKVWYQKYGTIKAKHIRFADISSSKVRLPKYIDKLANHAIKDTTRRSALLYSR